MVDFYGEDGAVAQPEDFFGLINAFVVSFARAHKEVVDGREAEAKKARLAAQAQSKPSPAAGAKSPAGGAAASAGPGASPGAGKQPMPGMMAIPMGIGPGMLKKAAPKPGAAAQESPASGGPAGSAGSATQAPSSAAAASSPAAASAAAGRAPAGHPAGSEETGGGGGGDAEGFDDAAPAAALRTASGMINSDERGAMDGLLATIGTKRSARSRATLNKNSATDLKVHLRKQQLHLHKNLLILELKLIGYLLQAAAAAVMAMQSVAESSKRNSKKFAPPKQS